MASSIGAKIELQGEAQFKKAVTEINTNLRTLGTEMTKVKSEFDKNDKSIESYTKKNEVLTKQIGEQKNKIEKKVMNILMNKTQNTNADTSALESEIDRLVYELYGLSEEEIGIVEEEK